MHHSHLSRPYPDNYRDRPPSPCLRIEREMRYVAFTLSIACDGEGRPAKRRRGEVRGGRIEDEHKFCKTTLTKSITQWPAQKQKDRSLISRSMSAFLTTIR